MPTKLRIIVTRANKLFTGAKACKVLQEIYGNKPQEISWRNWLVFLSNEKKPSIKNTSIQAGIYVCQEKKHCKANLSRYRELAEFSSRRPRRRLGTTTRLENWNQLEAGIDALRDATISITNTPGTIWTRAPDPVEVPDEYYTVERRSIDLNDL